MSVFISVFIIDSSFYYFPIVINFLIILLFYFFSIFSLSSNFSSTEINLIYIASSLFFLFLFKILFITYNGSYFENLSQIDHKFDFVISCVGNDDDLVEITTSEYGCFPHLNEKTIYIDHSTVSPKIVRFIENEAKKSFPDSKIVMVEAPAREYQEVLSGRADVSLTSKVDALKLINLYPELSIINIDEPKNAKLFAILLPRGDQEWINFINHWISDQKNKGFFNQTASKFGL